MTAATVACIINMISTVINNRNMFIKSSIMIIYSDGQNCGITYDRNILQYRLQIILLQLNYGRKVFMK